MAVNNSGKLLDSKNEIAIDFVWGNMPMQPDDDRTTRLDRSLGDHIIESTAWNGYPQYTPDTDGAFVAGVAYAVVPDLSGLTEASATDALLDASLVKGTVTTSSVGYVADPSNAGLVKSQSVAAGAASVAFGTSVNLVLFVAP
jgi:hypothetical protein